MVAELFFAVMIIRARVLVIVAIKRVIGLVDRSMALRVKFLSPPQFIGCESLLEHGELARL